MRNILLVFYLVACATATENSNEAKNDNILAPVDLSDRDNYREWEMCGTGESCLKRRIHICTNSTEPHISCGDAIWKEELIGCHTCLEDVWKPEGDVSKCNGNGCGDTVQHFVEVCSNRAVNPNCKIIRTRYCHPEDICNGTWTSWSSDSKECKDQCGPQRHRIMYRNCEKDGKPSPSCGGTIQQDTLIDHCEDTPCTTTVETPVTTKMKAAVTTWGDWSDCSATCENRVGNRFRTRSCEFEDGNKAPDTECGNVRIRDDKECSLENDGKCKIDRKSTTKRKETTTEQVVTTSTRETTDSPDGSMPEERGLKITPLDLTTRSSKMQGNRSTTTNSTLTQNQGLGAHDLTVLVIVFATVGVLVILVIVLYCICSKKKNKKDNRKKKIGEITVVGLQSHTGFMEGMESYGFTKSMMPSGPLLSAMGPTDEETVTETTVQVDPGLQINQNSHHIYEDMREDLPRTQSVPMRSRSYHESRSFSVRPHNKQAQDRRMSCFATQNSHTPRRTPPPKPPRMSLLLANSPGIREYREVPKCLYEEKYKDERPDLNFIQSIQPPASPPKNPFNTQYTEKLRLPSTASYFLSRSAPVSPVHDQNFPIHSPSFAYSPSPMILPYNAGPIMAPMQNTGVIYMPVSPIYPSTPLINPTPQNPQSTYSVVLRNKYNNAPPRRPQTLAFTPQISVSDADQDNLFIQHLIKSPTDDYAEMKQFLSPSFKKQNSLRSKEVNNNNRQKIAEDQKGYLVPTTV